jgi:hypothetical protein
MYIGYVQTGMLLHSSDSTATLTANTWRSLGLLLL